MSKHEYKGYRPLNQQVLVKFEPPKGKVITTMETAMEMSDKLFMEVLAVAPEVEDIEPGDAVYFPQKISGSMRVPIDVNFEVTNNGDLKDDDTIIAQVPYHTIMGVMKGKYISSKKQEKVNNAG